MPGTCRLVSTDWHLVARPLGPGLPPPPIPQWFAAALSPLSGQGVVILTPPSFSLLPSSSWLIWTLDRLAPWWAFGSRARRGTGCGCSGQRGGHPQS